MLSVVKWCCAGLRGGTSTLALMLLLLYCEREQQTTRIMTRIRYILAALLFGVGISLYILEGISADAIQIGPVQQVAQTN
jgi:hypothetical protein